MSRSLIIGGTDGLGWEIAQQSATYDFEPIITGRNVRRHQIVDSGIRAEPMDVTEDTDVARCIRRFEVQPSLAFRYLFYCPGAHVKGRFCDQALSEVDHVFGPTLFGFMNVIRHFHRMKKKPYHVVCIASTTSWKMRNDEATYGAAKAALAQFARNFHQELAADLPGSRTLIVHPGGMRTNFLAGSGVDAGNFMDPALVAQLIWQEIVMQESGKYPALHELHILRGKDGSPSLERGAKAPQ